MIFTMIAPCLFGLESLLAGELREMEAQNVRAENGRVQFEGDARMLARANINSRYAERICIQLGSFRAMTFEQLFQAVKGMPWEKWIGKTDAFPVKGRCLNSKLASVPTCQSIIKKAIVERLRSVYRVPWLEESAAVHQIQFLIMKDEVSIMIDTSGVGLHKRGYRANSTEAPIKETLAAAIAYLSRVRGDTVLYDPCCGSGTLLIEAALLALHIAPGLRRRFAAEKWSQIPAECWSEERRRAQGLIRNDCTFRAFGSDIDENAVRLTKENAVKAGVGSRIQVSQGDLTDFKPHTENGVILCNPPYGERLLDIQQAEALYQTMGKRFPKTPHWNFGIICPDEQFEHYFGRPADKRRKLYNGMIKCQLYTYSIRK